MARLIPNENTWVGFATTIADISAPTAAEVAAATDLTGFLASLNATTQGNTVPTPTLDTLFETSISGTVNGQFSADFYRDDTTDTAWDTLPRGTSGYFVVSRFGGSGVGNLPLAADVVEVWPVRVTARSMNNATSNQVLMFSVQAAIPTEPNENATVSV